MTNADTQQSVKAPIFLGEGKIGWSEEVHSPSTEELLIQVKANALSGSDRNQFYDVCVGHSEGLDLKFSSNLIAPERAVLGNEYFQFNELPENLQPIEENLPNLQLSYEMFIKGDNGKVIIEQ